MNIVILAPTQTTSEPAVISLELKMPTLAQSLKKKIDAFLLSLLSLRLFKEETVKELNEWQTGFNLQYSQNLATDEELEGACHALCFLLCEIIQPAMTEEKDLEKQEKIFEYEEELTKIIELALPEEYQTPEEFIQDYEIASQSESSFSDKLEIIESFYQKQITLLHETANHTSDNLRKTFEAIKKRLQEVNKSRINMSKEMIARLDNLTERVNKISKDMQECVKEAGNIAQQLKEQQASLEKILKEVSSVISEALK